MHALKLAFYGACHQPTASDPIADRIESCRCTMQNGQSGMRWNGRWKYAHFQKVSVSSDGVVAAPHNLGYWDAQM